MPGVLITLNPGLQGRNTAAPVVVLMLPDLDQHLFEKHQVSSIDV